MQNQCASAYLMTKQINIMKKISLITSVLIVLLFSCQKNIEKPVTQEEKTIAASQHERENGHLKQTKTFSANAALALAAQ